MAAAAQQPLDRARRQEPRQARAHRRRPGRVGAAAHRGAGRSRTLTATAATGSAADMPHVATLRLAALPRRQPQAQRVELDEAFGVALVVDRILLEGDVRLAVEAVGRLPADDACRAFVELEP